MTDRAIIEAGLTAAGVDPSLAGRVVDEYIETKRRFHLGDHRPTAVEGGRFCEAVTRVLEYVLLGSMTAVGKQLSPLDDRRLAQFAAARAGAESLRIHIPRALFLIYGVRNKRDAAHLADGISPNVQDSNLVMAVLDWVLGELVRLFHGVSAAEAERMISTLAVREVPVIEELGGQVLVNSELRPADRVLLLLYRLPLGESLGVGALLRQMRASHRGNLLRVVRSLDEKHMVYFDSGSDSVYLRQPGARHVESSGLLTPI